MTRLLIGNLLDSKEKPISRNLVVKIQGEIGKDLEERNAYMMKSPEEFSDEFGGEMSKTYEITGLGTVILHTNWINHPSIHAYLSNEALISGALELWHDGSPTVRSIKDIFSQFKMLLHRDEIRRGEYSRQYFDDAIFSRHMKRRYGEVLLHENP